MSSSRLDPIIGPTQSRVFLGIKSFFTRAKYKNASQTPSKAVHTPLHHLIGRFQQLRTFHELHPRLCTYIDIIKGKHNQVFVISKTYGVSLSDVLKRSQTHLSENQIKSVLFQVLDALVFLNSRQIVHRALCLDKILLDEQGFVKLADYGMYHMTKSGSLVAFPIGDPRYVSPEVIAEGIVFSESPDTPKSDIWSLGIMLFELISGGQLPWPQTSNTPFKVLLEVLNLMGHQVHVDLQAAKLQELEHSDIETLRIKESGFLSRSPVRSVSSAAGVANSSAQISHLSVESRQAQHRLLQERAKSQLELFMNSMPQFSRVSPELRQLLLLCLTIDPLERCTPAELINHPYFADLQSTRHEQWVTKPFSVSDLLELPKDNPIRLKYERNWQEQAEARAKEDASSGATSPPSTVTSSAVPPPTTSKSTETKPTVKKSEPIQAQDSEPYNPDTDPVNHITLEELFHIWRQGSGDIEGELAPELKISPPITRLPLFVKSKDSAAETVSDPVSKLIIQHQGSKDESRRYDDCTVKVAVETIAYLAERNSNFARLPVLHLDPNQWPNDIKEKDLDYQAQRICLFRSLLVHYPETRKQIIREARKDVPVILRAEIWAAILDVPSAAMCAKTYAEIDKDSEGPADRQIELDVPRCHQYHELLSSPEGHYKLKRVLKAWVKYNPNWGYWQGVDSFLAPFLVQNFNNEPLAFWCLQRAVEKFSRNLFDREKSVYLQEHLQIFKQLLAYHDPKLSMHLHKIGFQPALYAIPWFLTLFTQFFSLDQIAKLWDRVLLASSQLPFYLAFSMMKQLRDILLPLDFNACILLFSSLPGVDIEAFIREARIVAQETPSSITEANYKHSPTKSGDTDEPALPKYNPTQVIDRWWEKQVPLEELQAELFPRLSATDLAAAQFKFVVLDIRDRSSFEKVSVPDSVLVDASPQALGNSSQQAELSKKLDQNRGAHFVVLGDKNRPGRQFANFLVSNGIPRVSMLNGGIEALLADVPAILMRDGLPPLTLV